MFHALFILCFFFFTNILFIVAWHSFCLVADYSQNLGLPHFGGEQPGDTYYYSPLAVYIFGIVDASCSPDKLYAYGYTEDIGAKGGNNVASLLMLAMEDFGWLSSGKCGKRLSIVMDNCSGQNKNNHVLRLALLLVELQHFKEVEFIFYVRGHTKNVCDRMFNLLKKRYHHSQIFSITKLTELLNEIDNVNYIHVPSTVFFNYQLLLSLFYKIFPTGEVKKNHYFWVSDANPTTMGRLTHHNDPYAEPQHFDHSIRMANRITEIKLAMNNKFPLPAPGLKPIKQVELWKKWGQYIPEDERDELCPKPTDDVIKKVAAEKASKAKTAQRKRASTAKAAKAAAPQRKKKSQTAKV